MFSIIFGVFGILSVYQFIKLSHKILTLLDYTKLKEKEGLLIEELNKLDDEDFYYWTIDYMKLLGFEVKNKLSLNLINLEKNNIDYGCLVIKKGLAEDDLYFLQSLKHLNNWQELIVLTLDRGDKVIELFESVDDDLKITIIDGNTFNIKYDEFILKKRNILIEH